MALFDRFRRGRRGGTGGPSRAEVSADESHLTAWADAREGVEGFVEPRTTASPVTLLLVAKDGEWTRRKVPSVEWAHKFANRRGIPSYDAAVVGIPARMREYNKRQKQQALDQLKDL